MRFAGAVEADLLPEQRPPPVGMILHFEAPVLRKNRKLRNLQRLPVREGIGGAQSVLFIVVAAVIPGEDQTAAVRQKHFDHLVAQAAGSRHEDGGAFRPVRTQESRRVERENPERNMVAQQAALRPEKRYRRRFGERNAFAGVDQPDGLVIFRFQQRLEFDGELAEPLEIWFADLQLFLIERAAAKRGEDRPVDRDRSAEEVLVEAAEIARTDVAGVTGVGIAQQNGPGADRPGELQLRNLRNHTSRGGFRTVPGLREREIEGGAQPPRIVVEGGVVDAACERPVAAGQKLRLEGVGVDAELLNGRRAAGGAESEHLPHDGILDLGPDRLRRRQAGVFRIDEVEIACFQVVAERLLTAGAVALPAEEIVDHHAVESGFDRDADDLLEIVAELPVFRARHPAEIVPVVVLKGVVAPARRPRLKIRNLPLHQLVVERGELDVGEHGDVVPVSGGKSFLQAGQILFFLFPAHSLVEVAVQNVGADLLHAGEGFLRVEPAVPRLHPLRGALHTTCAAAADAPVHQK